MNVSLNPDVQKLIDERVNSGQCSSPEEVVEAAVLALEQVENFGEFEAGALDQLLAEGEQSLECEVTVSGNRHEVDHSDALAVNDGVALFAGPGGVPVIFDFEGVSEVIGDLSGRGRRTGRSNRKG